MVCRQPPRGGMPAAPINVARPWPGSKSLILEGPERVRVRSSMKRYQAINSLAPTAGFRRAAFSVRTSFREPRKTDRRFRSVFLASVTTSSR